LGRVYWKLNESFYAIKNYEEYIVVATPNYEMGGVLQAAEYLLEVTLNPNYHENPLTCECSQHPTEGEDELGLERVYILVSIVELPCFYIKLN
jgi:hypothetical protein